MTTLAAGPITTTDYHTAGEPFRIVTGGVPALEGRTGEITSVPLSPDSALKPDPAWPNWWTDDPSPDLIEGPHRGARTINQWREQFLRDFADRLERCRIPKP